MAGRTPVTAELLLELFMSGHRFVHLVGGGGKTTLMFALARAHVDRGRTVITTTTTRILRPGPHLSPEVITGEVEPAVVRAALARHGLVTLALSEEPGTGKLLGHAPEYLAAIHAARIADAILVEADGSAGRPLKAHRDHEPVVCPEADRVIVVTGCDAIGAVLSDASVHRPEIVAERFDVPPGTILDAALVARVLLEDHLARLPSGAAVTFFISRVTGEARRLAATDLAARLARDGRVARIVLGDLAAGRLECWRSG
ncbi:MAG: putative selenium-dependent hydroxylase accessory protein YqeC [Candidatus Riflebacteria bacterium]|nr:putative selenium-dependent hydroxylase accessory protein YqeC [Candidatus Riflebacteria bacterium]